MVQTLEQIAQKQKRENANEKANIAKFVFQNPPLISNIDDVEFHQNSQLTEERKRSSRGLFCDNLIGLYKIPESEWQTKKTGKPLIKNTEKYQTMFLEQFRVIFGDAHLNIKFQTSCVDAWLQPLLKKGEERWGRFKIALNQVSITDIEDFANKLKKLQDIGMMIYDIDFTWDLKGCLDYDEMKEFLENECGITTQPVRAKTMVQWIDGVYRCKYYDKVVYNMLCRNQNDNFGSNFNLNLDCNEDRLLEWTFQEFGRTDGITRLEITMKTTQDNPINRQTLDNLKEQIERCIAYYEQCECVYKNPLQNYIANYTNAIDRQLLIKTKENLFVVWSYCKKTGRVQGVCFARSKRLKTKQQQQDLGTTHLQISEQEDQKLQDTILSNMFFNTSIFVVDLSQHNMKKNTREDVQFGGKECYKVKFAKPYKSTLLLSKKSQFFRTSKPQQEIEQYNNPQLNIHYQSAQSSHNIWHFGSRIPTLELIQYQAKYDCSTSIEHYLNWEMDEPVRIQNKDKIRQYMSVIVEQDAKLRKQQQDQEYQLQLKQKPALEIVERIKKIVSTKYNNRSTIDSKRCIAILFIVEGKNNQHIIIDIYENLYTIYNDRYVEKCVISDHIHVEKIQQDGNVYKFRLDGQKIATLFNKRLDDYEHTQHDYKNNRNQDEQQIQLQEETKLVVQQIEETKLAIQQIDTGKIPNTITQKEFTAIKQTIDDLQENTNYTISDCAQYKKGEEIFFVVKIGDQQYKQNKFLRDVINQILQQNEGKLLHPIQIKTGIKVYYPADKKGKQLQILVI